MARSKGRRQRGVRRPLKQRICSHDSLRCVQPALHHVWPSHRAPETLAEVEHKELEVPEEHEDSDTKSRQVLLEQLDPRNRRRVLGKWTNRRVQEMCAEDENESDSEDEALRSALMDSLGTASANVEADLANTSPELLAESYRSDDAVQQRTPRVSFSPKSSMCLMRQIDDSELSSWRLDDEFDIGVFFVPSAPLKKWKECAEGDINKILEFLAVFKAQAQEISEPAECDTRKMSEFLAVFQQHPKEISELAEGDASEILEFLTAFEGQPKEISETAEGDVTNILDFLPMLDVQPSTCP